DLPALLKVRLPGPLERYAALTGLGEDRGGLSGHGASVSTDIETFQSIWTGEAHVLWRDFEKFGATLQPGSRGAAGAQLQELLRRLGEPGVGGGGAVGCA